MFVITVIPLKKGITVDSLSYFCPEAYPEGTILKVPIRNSTALGLVTGVKEVSAAKTALRAATFSLKKLAPQTDTLFLGAAYLKTAKALSQYYAAPIGTILFNLLPPEVRNGDIEMPHTHHIDAGQPTQPHILQAHRQDRYRAYRSLVRETFAHSGSVLIMVPTSVDAEEIQKELEAGIEDRLVVLTSTMPKSILKKGYKALEDFSKTKLIIATPSHALIERHDITHVVIENARSAYFKEMVRPYIDYRDAIKEHARHTGRKLLIADLLLRTEEEYFRREETYLTYGETPKRVELPGKLTIVDMEKKNNDDVTFKLFSDELIQEIKDIKKKRGKMFLFAARRGLAPLVVCQDCMHICRSDISGAPYSLVRTYSNGEEKRWFVCATSGERIPAPDTCKNCGSWRLKERGIGIQNIYDELRKIFPEIPVTLFDHISAKTYKRARFLQENFYKTKGGILLGTHMALPYLTGKIDLSAVVNMDALLATPTWRLEEENLSLILKMREVTHGNVFIQTRTKDAAVLKHATHGTTESFYTEELELRKQFNYPPHSTFIHLTWQGTKEQSKSIYTLLSETFVEYKIQLYPNPTAVGKNMILYGLIKVPAQSWPDEKLGALLRSIPPSVRVMMNPDKIV